MCRHLLKQSSQGSEQARLAGETIEQRHCVQLWGRSECVPGLWRPMACGVSSVRGLATRPPPYHGYGSPQGKGSAARQASGWMLLSPPGRGCGSPGCSPGGSGQRRCGPGPPAVGRRPGSASTARSSRSQRWRRASRAELEVQHRGLRDTGGHLRGCPLPGDPSGAVGQLSSTCSGGAFWPGAGPRLPLIILGTGASVPAS